LQLVLLGWNDESVIVKAREGAVLVEADPRLLDELISHLSTMAAVADGARPDAERR
jgi:hypothetical protein